MQQSNAAAAAAAPPHDQPGSGEAPAEAPPKQVALAMERLTRAARLIADIRLGADHLIEALFAAADAPHHSSNTVNLIIKEEASMRQHFDDLRALGRQLEDTGVLNGSLKSRGNSWGLHMPLVCPDGAVVAYAWKRQLAGQAGASAVDRTRLALKAFTDQKRRFFPHLEVKPSAQTYELGVVKRHCSPQGVDPRVELREEKTLSDVLHSVEHDMPSVRISTYQRLDWLKRVSSLSNLGAMNVVESSKDHSIHTLDKLREGSTNVAAADQIAVIELLVPSVFRAVVSLHPAGSTEPDAVAFFSPDEGGNYVHARGQSGFHVFKQITEFADKALQYFLSVDRNMSLSLLLRWVCNYETIFKAACGKCMRLQAVDKSTAMFLPAVYRPYTQTSTNQMTGLPQDSSTENTTAYHAGCLVNEARR